MDNLDTLLADLQNTTAASKRIHHHKALQHEDASLTVSDSQDDVRMSSASGSISTLKASHRGLNDVEHFIDDFGGKRNRAGQNGRPSVESLLDTLDSAVSSSDRNVKHAKQSDFSVSAQTASKELDDLMTSLSEFKVKPAYDGTSDNAYAKLSKPKDANNQLDSMLGSLQSDMNKHGIKTVPKGDCAACQKTIVGQVVIALGKMWHPEHFTCAHCGEELSQRNFFERSNKSYCETDYHNLFSPRCAYCNGPIKEKCITALEKTWHPEHFFCAQCGRDFGDEGFHEKDGKAFCRNDYFDTFAPRCRGCDEPIVQNYITALSTHWHPECFVCADCRNTFVGGSFFDYNGRPYCETHYHEKRGSLCAGCNKPISGRCVTAMSRKYHPEHFVCSFCLRQLNKGTFKEHESKPYCHQCFTKLLT